MIINCCLSFIICSLLFISCSKEIVLPESLENLIATYKDHNCICDPAIDQYIWRGKTVFAAVSKAPDCDSRPRYYYKNGVQFEMEAGYKFTKFLAESRFVKNRWNCQASEKTP